VQTGERVVSTLGGSGAVAAYTAAALGMSEPGGVRLWSAVGTDPFGEMALNWLEGRKVDTTSVRIMSEAGTATTVMLSDAAHQRETFYYPGASGAFSPRARSVSGGPSDWLLVAGYAQLPGWRGDNTLELLGSARRNRINTALDFGSATDKPITKDELRRMLQHVSVLLCAAHELEHVTGIGVSEAARWALDAGAGVVVVRNGAKGVAIFEGDKGERTDVPGFPVVEGDVAGVGDSFNAAFLFERGRGASLTDSARFGIAVASFVANAPRGVLDTPDEAAARAEIELQG
jgi:sugar/nucleoside kinase (ribokinase family)